MFNRISMRCLYIFLLSVVLAGCASHQLVAPSYSLTVDFNEPQRIRFSGKGAGAGMMLSASMGPMGIAIGVAIDEGIAKDIQGAFSRSGYDLPKLVSTSFDSAMQQVLSSKSSLGIFHSNIGIHIQSIGFKTASGDGDPVVSSVDGSIEYLGTTTQIAQIVCPALAVVPVQLDKIKVNGDVSYQSFNQHLSGLFECWAQAVVEQSML